MIFIEGVTQEQSVSSKVETGLPGSVSYRVQAHQKVRLDKPLYVSYDKSDHIANIATALGYPDYGVASDYRIEDGNLYNVSIKAKKPLKAPSYQHAMETFVEMVGDKGVKQINPYDQDCVNGQKFIKSWKMRGKSEVGASYAYTLFIDNMRKDRNKKFYEEFSDRLAKKGYNSLIDPEDFNASSMKKSRNGEEVFRKAPMIILKPNSDLLDITVDKLTKEDLRYLSRYDLDYGDIDYEDLLINKNPSRVSSDTRKTHEKWKKWYHQ